MHDNEKIKTVLLVEDEAVISIITSKALKKFGYRVISSNSGEDAVRIALEDEKISMVLMDINLGDGIDGTEAARQILVARNLPIVFHTSHSEREMVEKVRGITRYGYVIKSSGDFVLQLSLEMAYEMFYLNEKTKKNEEHYRALFQNTGTWLIAIEEDMTISLVNDEFARSAGYAREEIEGKRKWTDFVDQKDIDRMIGQHWMRRENQQTALKSYEFGFKTRSGDILDTFITVSMIPGTKKSIASMIDVSERKRIKKELRDKNEELEAMNEEFEAANEELIAAYEDLFESESLYRTMFENTGTAMILIEDDMMISKVNGEFVKRTGYSPDDIAAGTQWGSIVHPDDVQMIIERHRQRRDNPENAPSSYDIRYITKSGDLRQATMNVQMVPGTGKSIASIVDITESRLAEEKIKMLLREKELILKEVHHRIKNNMNSINGLLSLQCYTLKDQSAVAALEDAGSRVRSMMVLYDKLYCSADYGNLSVKNYFVPLIDQIVSNFPGDISISVEKRIEDFMLDVKVLSSLGMIINELLTNIMKHAFRGRERGLIKVSASMAGNRAAVVMEDDGIGLPDTVSFEKPAGFGLDLVGMLTEQIGGNIRIERGSGTRFVLEFDV